MPEKVVIIGCGWLGQQLAPYLAQSGYTLYGSRRSNDGAAMLAPPIHGFALDLSAEVTTDAKLLALLADAWLICAIPLGRQQPSGYVSALNRLALLGQQAGIKGGIHCSSTGVYQGNQGRVSEQTPLCLGLSRVKLLADGEQALQQAGWLTLRLAGLMGPGRHPARFTQGKVLTGAEHPVNMIHAFDIAQALLAIFNQWPLAKPCYNLSAPEWVTKRDFYHCANLGRDQAAEFSRESDPAWRKVMAEAITEDTAFRYRYADPRTALLDCH